MTELTAAERQVVERAVRGIRARRSKRVAVFLGAGASKQFGYPLTSELLRTIVTWLGEDDFLADLQGEASFGKRNRRLLRQYLLQLMPGKSLRRNNLPLVTSLLSLLDYSLATGQSVLPARSMDETRWARRLLERAILEAIADEVLFNDAEQTQLRRFCRLLTDLKGNATRLPLTVITTNYDMASDEAVYRCAGIRKKRGRWRIAEIGATIDFGFRWLHPMKAVATTFVRPKQPAVSLFKLHGSTNWLRCPLCDNIYVNSWGPIWRHAYKRRPDYASQCHCSATQLEAQIVSPSFVREMREPNLLGVWKAALDALRDADEWIVIGYSFPDEDVGVRALFARAYGSRGGRFPHITVVQHDRSSFARYDAFFEPSELTFCTGGLGAFVNAWLATKGRR